MRNQSLADPDAVFSGSNQRRETLFCPWIGNRAVQALGKEQLADQAIHSVRDTMIALASELPREFEVRIRLLACKPLSAQARRKQRDAQRRNRQVLKWWTNQQDPTRLARSRDPGHRGRWRRLEYTGAICHCLRVSSAEPTLSRTWHQTQEHEVARSMRSSQLAGV